MIEVLIFIFLQLFLFLLVLRVEKLEKRVKILESEHKLRVFADEN